MFPQTEVGIHLLANAGGGRFVAVQLDDLVVFSATSWNQFEMKITIFIG